jgi:hypothetical protein
VNDSISPTLKESLYYGIYAAVIKGRLLFYGNYLAYEID